jgi:hypothetical protein
VMIAEISDSSGHSVSVCSVPDASSTLLLLGGGLVALVGFKRRFSKRSNAVQVRSV